MTVGEICDIVGGSWLNEQPDQSRVIEHLVIDSRQLLFPEKSLFIAMPGQRVDGHDFLSSVYAMGGRNFMVTKDVDHHALPDANWIRVADATAALQQLAAYHRARFSLLSIGITGSNGKTIIKEWLAQLLEADYAVVKTPRSYNSQIGVPLSVWQIRKQHEIGIFEAGISRKGEMKKLAPLIHCQLGIFTNIGPAHDAGFSTREEKVLEKLQLFTNVECLFYCRDHSLVHQAVTQQGIRTFTWSYHEEADLHIFDIVSMPSGTQLQARWQDHTLQLALPFSDPASIENAIHCWCVLLYLGTPQERIQERILALQPIAMRLEVKEGTNNCTLINDSYNADLSALQLALYYLEQRAGESPKTLILSDILQSGLADDQLYQSIAANITARSIQKLIAVGHHIKILQQFLPPGIEAYYFPTTEKLLDHWEDLTFKDEVILLKGARHFRFERIAARLSKKEHLTTLEVDLNALLHNFLTYKSLLHSGTKMMVMVKAAAYGSGSVEIAKYLEANGVDYLAVAYTDEGVELRKAGIKTSILVLNPEEASFDPLVRYQLEPEIYSLKILDQFAQFLGPTSPAYPVHLKIDTGMHRLGFTPQTLASLIQKLHQYPSLHVASIFSHLAASDAKKHRAFTLRQIEAFQDAYQQISKAIGYFPIRHILNSGGIVRYAHHQMDMVRLGLGLYGIDSTGSLADKLQPVLQLKAHISQIKVVPAGESIGYDRSGKAVKDMRIGVLSIGYADGLLRGAGNGNFKVLIRGQKVQTIGNICMDMCMVNLNKVPKAREGDEVLIFGRDLPVKRLAKALKTIPYEIFTNISPRVRRIYIRE
jgi:alanine racemase